MLLALICLAFPPDGNAASRPPPVTVVVDIRPFAVLDSAANGEARVDWCDLDESDDVACTEAFAARELADALPRCLTGETRILVLGDRGEIPGEGDIVVLGRACRTAPFARFRARARTRIPEAAASFRVETVRAGRRRVCFVEGRDRTGTLYAAYALLESFGMRFFGPDTEDVVWPAATETMPDSLRLEESPGFETRGFWAWENRGGPRFLLWMARNRLNLWTVEDSCRALAHKLGILLTAGGHDVQLRFLDPARPYPYRRGGDEGAGPPDPHAPSPEPVVDRDGDGRISMFEAHPEWYGLQDGRRSPRVGAESGDNICTSNPDAVAEFVRALRRELDAGVWRDADVLALWMHDNGRWCTCERCRQRGSPTDRLLAWTARIAEGLRREPPRRPPSRPLQLTTLAFLETSAAPTHPLDPALLDGHFSVFIFQMYRCYEHPLDSLLCPEINATSVRVIEQWRQKLGQVRCGLGIGEYYNIDRLMSLPQAPTHVLPADLAWYRREGVCDVHTMHVVTQDWGPWTWFHRLWALSLWNPSVSGDSLLDDFVARYYPAAHAEMRAFYTALEEGTGPLKLIKHRAQVEHRLFDLRRQMEGGAPPTPIEHLGWTVPADADAYSPVLTRMDRALAEARRALDAAEHRANGGAEARRIRACDRPLAYAQATVDFYARLLAVYGWDLKHDAVRARRAYPALERSAARLETMHGVSLHAGSHARADDGLAATGMGDWVLRFRKAYGADGGARSRP